MAALFDITHETGDLTQYDSTVTDGGDMSAAMAAALVGSWGLQCVIDDINPMYGQKGVTVSGNDVRFRFYLDPNSLTMGNGEGFRIIHWQLDAFPWNLCLVLLKYYTVGGYQVLASAEEDDGTTLWTSDISISDAPTCVEIHIDRATSDVADDGQLRIWINGALQNTISNVDNYDLWSDISDAQMGAIAGIDAGTSGTFFLDDFKANDDGGTIGCPTLTTSTTSTTSTTTTTTVTTTTGTGTTVSTTTTLPEAADPNAIEAARKILKYLQDLSSETIVGQHLFRTALIATGWDRHYIGVYDTVGVYRWPAMIGCEYWWDATAANRLTANTYLKRHWNTCGLVQIQAHFDNPWTGGDARNLTGRNLADLSNHGSAVYPTWEGYMSDVADGLEDLADDGVVVLWRPFHEMTFNNTWWWDVSAEPNPNNPTNFIAMWQDMFDYFTTTRGLHNLLWVYSSANSDTWRHVDVAYPGDSYVDITGIDLYNPGTIRGSGYGRMTALGKPFAITEFGPPTGQRSGNYDNTDTIDLIKASYPATTYWLQWHSFQVGGVWQYMALDDCLNLDDLFNDAWVIDRASLDWNGCDLDPTRRMATWPSAPSYAARIHAGAETALISQAGASGETRGELKAEAERQMEGPLDTTTFHRNNDSSLAMSYGDEPDTWPEDE